MSKLCDILLITTGAIFAGVGAVNLWNNKPNKSNEVSNFEAMSQMGGGATITKIRLYYVKWCPYCKEFMPNWDTFKERVRRRYRTQIVCDEIDCDVVSNVPSLVESYPTIVKIMSDGTMIKVQAKSAQDRQIERLAELIGIDL